MAEVNRTPTAIPPSESLRRGIVYAPVRHALEAVFRPVGERLGLDIRAVVEDDNGLVIRQRDGARIARHLLHFARRMKT